MEAYRHQAIAYYNKWSKLGQFQVKDLILRKMFENMVDPEPSKLQVN